MNSANRGESLYVRGSGPPTRRMSRGGQVSQVVEGTTRTLAVRVTGSRVSLMWWNSMSMAFAVMPSIPGNLAAS